jgi:hypothetical protein
VPPASRRRTPARQATANRGGVLLIDSAFTDTYSFVLTAASGGTHLTQREKFTGLLISFTGKLPDETAGSFAALNEALKRRAEAR